MRTTLLALTALAALTTAACGTEPDNPAGAPQLPPGTNATDTGPTATNPTATGPTATGPTHTGPSTTDAAPPNVAPPTTPPPLPRYDIDTVRAELDAARARWVEQPISAYRYDYQYTCFCVPDEARANVVVLDGRIVNDNGRGTFFTVDEWFDQIDAAIGTAADVRAEYDDLGYPTAVYIDVEEMVADEEFGLELKSFTPAADDVITAFMPDEYGCGYGFAVAAPDQTMSLTAHFAGVFDDTGPAPGSYDLADLDAEIRIGSDLMANWCDDVVEAGEPEAAVRETWQVTQGRLDVTVSADRIAVGTFVGVVAAAPDGTELALGDATISNTAWGLFAG